MPDRFDDIMREKLGGFNALSRNSGAGSAPEQAAHMEADWASMAERLDAVDAARGQQSDKRIGLLLFALIALGSVALGIWYQLDGGTRGLNTETIATQSPQAVDQASSKEFSLAPSLIPSEMPGSTAAAAANAENDGAAPASTSPLSEAQVSTAGFAQEASAIGSASETPARSRERARSGQGAREHQPVDPNADASPAAGVDLAANSGPDQSVAQSAQSSMASPSAGITARTSGSAARSMDEGRPEVYSTAPMQRALTQASVETSGSASPALSSEASPEQGAQSRTAAERQAAIENPALLDRESSASQVLRQWALALPVQPMAAQAGPYLLPSERDYNKALSGVGRKDPSLRKAPLRYSLTFGPDLNAAFSGVGDALRPSWDLSLSGEIWFPKQVFVSAGLRYGLYRLHKVGVNCGDHAAHGLSDHVHCPDAMTGDQALWEIPVRVGYGVDVANGKGRIRGFAGLSTRIQRRADYDIEFHGVRAGDTLFFDPIVITVAESAYSASNSTYSYDTDMLESMATSGSATATPGSNPNGLNSSERRTSLALEFGVGYEQFLGPNVSLGIEPRVALPLQSLPMNNGRAYHIAAGALLRWYPGRP